MNDLISIIVPVYNMEKYLERCIESILSQTYRELEIILVDDGSADSSPQICDDYALKDNRIKVIHKENGGLSDARNAGLMIATGAYIGYVDSDDWIEPDMYERMYNACVLNNAELSVCRYFSEFADGTVGGGDGREEVLDREELLRIYISGRDGYLIYNSVWSKLFKRELVEGVVFPKGQNSEDIMYTTKAFCKLNKAVYIDLCLYHYVLDRKDSIMNVAKPERMFKDELPFWREHIAYIRDNVSPDMADLASYYYYRRLLFYYIDMSDKCPESALKLADMIKSDKNNIIRVYSKDNNTVSRGDRARMRLFMINPKIYALTVKIYEKVIIPLRQ
jgi:glycosyltransferase involved in cell wall biosynthesis